MTIFMLQKQHDGAFINVGAFSTYEAAQKALCTHATIDKEAWYIINSYKLES